MRCPVREPPGEILRDLPGEIEHHLPEVLASQDLPTHVVDHRALLVHHVVVFEEVLPDVEVVPLDLLLGVLDRAVDERVLDRLPLFHPQLLHDRRDPVGAEDPEQVVLEREVEARGARVPLPSRAAAQLVVDPAGLVPLRPDDVEPPLPDDPLAQLDVHAAAGHVRGDGHPSRMARLGDDLRLLLVVLGVQNVMGNAVAREQPGEPLGFLDRDGAYQDRPPLRVQLLDLLEDRLELLLLRPVDLVGEVLTDHRLVRRHDGYGEFVDLLELGRLGVGRPGHAGQLVEHSEVVLEGDGGQRLVLVLDPDPFLGLHRLVETVGPAPPRHEAPGELVDDDDLAVLHHVVHVPVEQDVGLERLVHVVEHLDVARVVEVVHRQETFELGDPRLLGEEHLAGLLVDRVVGVLLEERDDGVHPRVEGGGLLRGAGDDERRPRLVDQDRVDLVHDRVMEVPLHHVLHPELHVVPEVVEAELVVRPVGDVATVGRLALRVVHPVDDDAHGHSEGPVELPHPVGVAPGEVVVHRHEVHAPPGQGVQDDREGGHERLPLAGPHLGDPALVEDDAAHQLDVEGTHVEDALPGLPDDGERLGEKVVQRLAVLDPLAEFGDLRGEPVVGERADRGLERVHPVHGRADPVEDPLVVRAKHLFQEVSEHDGEPRGRSVSSGSARGSPGGRSRGPRSAGGALWNAPWNRLSPIPLPG